MIPFMPRYVDFTNSVEDRMFGTDVGYMTDYDTTDEFEALALCNPIDNPKEFASVRYTIRKGIVIWRRP